MSKLTKNDMNDGRERVITYLSIDTIEQLTAPRKITRTEAILSAINRQHSRLGIVLPHDMHDWYYGSLDNLVAIALRIPREEYGVLVNVSLENGYDGIDEAITACIVLDSMSKQKP